MPAIEAAPDVANSLAAAPRLLHALFEAQAARRPNHPAIECRGRTLTYAELDRLANRFAHWVRARRIGPDQLVALHLEKSVELFAAMLGVLKAGAGYVPIDPKFPADRIASILEDGKIALVVSQTSLAATEGRPETLLVDRNLADVLALPDSPIAAAECGVGPANICYVIYTSGSTGRPKGVAIEHRNAICFCAALPTSYGITESDRVYQGFSTAFDAAVEEVWAAFSLGGTLVVPPDELTRFGQPRPSIQRTASSMWTHMSPTMPLLYSMKARQPRGWTSELYGRRGAGPVHIS